jgi:hypothetical protein
MCPCQELGLWVRCFSDAQSPAWQGQSLWKHQQVEILSGSTPALPSPYLGLRPLGS